MITVRGLEANIGGRTICKDLSFALPAGQSLAILGRNGAGKSTLLATLAGLRAADRGQIELQGRDLAGYGARELACLRAYCAQQQHDAFEATVLETVLLGRHPHQDRWAWESVHDTQLARAALHRVGLGELSERSVQSLSGGERQRLAIATSLVQQPQLYLLDEPLSHLDLNHAMVVLALLRDEAVAGRSVVAVMHEPNLALRHFDHALLLQGDGSWQFGRSREVLTAETLTQLYGHPLRTLHDNDEPWFIPE